MKRFHFLGEGDRPIEIIDQPEDGTSWVPAVLVNLIAVLGAAWLGLAWVFDVL